MKYDFDLEDRSKKRKQMIIRILILGLEIGVVIFAAYALMHYGLEKMTVSGEYMSPTLKNKDEILINKISYRIHSIKRNDVVVVRHNGSEHSYFTVERVIGLPGEKVLIQDGEIFIDGKKLQEKYQFPVMENGGLALEEITLDHEEYFMLCDNRNECEDSRNANIGNVLKENIVGKAWIRLNSFTLISHIDAFSENEEANESDASSETNTP